MDQQTGQYQIYYCIELIFDLLEFLLVRVYEEEYKGIGYNKANFFLSRPTPLYLQKLMSILKWYLQH